MRARIVEWDRRTWWGTVQYDLTLLKFHGTCVHGMRSTDETLVGRECEIVFNQSYELLSVHLT